MKTVFSKFCRWVTSCKLLRKKALLLQGESHCDKLNPEKMSNHNQKITCMGFGTCSYVFIRIGLIENSSKTKERSV
jgi:hypothetical protein